MIRPIFQMRKQSLPEVKGLAQGHMTAKRWGLDSHLGPTDCRPQPVTTLVHWLPAQRQTVILSGHEPVHPRLDGPLPGGWCLYFWA